MSFERDRYRVRQRRLGSNLLWMQAHRFPDVRCGCLHIEQAHHPWRIRNVELSEIGIGRLKRSVTLLQDMPTRSETLNK